jgi:hypothetical protein
MVRGLIELAKTAEDERVRSVCLMAVLDRAQHCPKAPVRSDLWQAAAAGRPKGVPTLGGFAAALATPCTDGAAMGI